MIYTGLNHTGEVQVIHTHGGGTVGTVYGGIGEVNPIYYKTRTITGQTPLSYKALSKPLSDYLISGNTTQNGVPTPDNPVDVVGCGVRTENLFDWSTVTTGYRITWATGVLIEDEAAIMSDYIRVSPGIYRADASFNLVGYDANKAYVGTYDPISKTFRKEHGSKTSYYDLTNANVTYVKLMSFSTTDTLSASTMLNSGGVALPYEPYGYKLPPTVNGTEYPIYLGQVPTTRLVKKLVLTGEEEWITGTVGANRFFYYYKSDAAPIYTAIRSSYYIPSNVPGAQRPNNSIRQTASATAAVINIRDDACATLYDFKSYLAAQYANSTPVTVWYVLAEPETGIVNEPLMKIGEYADTISMAQAGVTIPTVAGANTLTIDTTVQPSAVSITGNIKEVSR